MFDYILTGPISGMSAGQYIMGLLLDTVKTINPAVAPSHDDGRFHPPLGRGGHRLRHHALLLPPEPGRHPRVERQGPEDHGRHDRHGRGHAGLVRRHPAGPRPGQPRAAGARSCAQGGIPGGHGQGPRHRRKTGNVAARSQTGNSCAEDGKRPARAQAQRGHRQAGRSRWDSSTSWRPRWPSSCSSRATGGA